MGEPAQSKRMPDRCDIRVHGGMMTDLILQDGMHIARITAVEMPDGTFEARVFVRLTREPEIAETYIPAGIFPTFEKAMKGAELRAQRAFDEDEF
jgi:hypothetical protein